MAEISDFLSISQTAELLGLSIAETNELVRRNILESRTGIFRSSVNRYLASVSS